MAFLKVIQEERTKWPFKLISYVLMPDHIHMVVNPSDGEIIRLMQILKSLTSKAIISAASGESFNNASGVSQIWQQSFKAMPLWSNWMIWQKINYIHSNPLKKGLVRSVGDYRWSSYRSFYFGDAEPIQVDKDWWWPGDVKKLARASAEWSKELAAEKRDR